MDISQRENEEGQEIVHVIFTCLPPVEDGENILINKRFIPFHTVAKRGSYPRRIWRHFARGMGSVGHAPVGDTVAALVSDSSHWLMPDAILCDEDGEYWKVCNYDWGEPAGEPQLYEPPKIVYEPDPLETAEEETAAAPAAPLGDDDLPF